MKKILFAIIIFGCSALSYAAADKSLSGREFESYEDAGTCVTSVEVTLGSAGIVSTATVPSCAKGFRIYPRTNHVRFSVQIGNSSNFPEAVGTVSSGAEVTSSSLKVGGIAKNDLWETRLLPYDGRQRYLYLRSTTSSVVVDLEFF